MIKLYDETRRAKYGLIHETGWVHLGHSIEVKRFDFGMFMTFNVSVDGILRKGLDHAGVIQLMLEKFGRKVS